MERYIQTGCFLRQAFMTSSASLWRQQLWGITGRIDNLQKHPFLNPACLRHSGYSICLGCLWRQKKAVETRPSNQMTRPTQIMMSPQTFHLCPSIVQAHALMRARLGTHPQKNSHRSAYRSHPAEHQLHRFHAGNSTAIQRNESNKFTVII